MDSLCVLFLLLFLFTSLVHCLFIYIDTLVICSNLNFVGNISLCD